MLAGVSCSGWGRGWWACFPPSRGWLRASPELPRAGGDVLGPRESRAVAAALCWAGEEEGRSASHVLCLNLLLFQVIA